MLYTEIPQGLHKECHTAVANSPGPGCITFDFNLSGSNVNKFFLQTHSHLPSVGDLFIFPAGLPHWVYPFKTTEGERVSISGNIHLIDGDKTLTPKMIAKKSKYKSVVIKKKRYYFYKITWVDPTGDSGHANAHDSLGLVPSKMVTHAYLFHKDKKISGLLEVMKMVTNYSPTGTSSPSAVSLRWRESFCDSCLLFTLSFISSNGTSSNIGE